MKTINTKRVGDTFVPDDMDPYSEYVHDGTVRTNVSEEVAMVPQQQVHEAPFNREAAMKNFNEFIEGVDVMTEMLTEIFKRFR